MDNNHASWPGWETVRLIGRGSSGAVYEIQRDVFGEVERAALKVISIPQNESDIEELYIDCYDEESVTAAFQSHRDSIISEYSLMRKMNGYTNIVSCDDIRCIQHDDGIGWDIFIKMELLTPLTKALPAQIDEQTVMKIARDICAALVLCHKSNILHRDVKPRNIFVSQFGDYKLGDFGIAKTVEGTSNGTIAGTGPYMAPEVAHYQPYGHSADIYSLGIVLYCLLNERRMPFMPLPPEKPTFSMEQQAKDRRLRGEPLPPPAHGSEKLKAIVLKACAYDLKERYHTAEEMAKDLAAIGDLPFNFAEHPQPEKKICAACGTQLLPGRRFCVKCGAPIDKVAAHKTVGPAQGSANRERGVLQKERSHETPQFSDQKELRKKTPEQPSETKHTVKNVAQKNGCPHCGAALLTGRKFCVKCGEHIHNQAAQGALNAEQVIEERFRLLQQERERRRKEQEGK